MNLTTHIHVVSHVHVVLSSDEIGNETAFIFTLYWTLYLSSLYSLWIWLLDIRVSIASVVCFTFLINLILCFMKRSISFWRSDQINKNHNWLRTFRKIAQARLKTFHSVKSNVGLWHSLATPPIISCLLCWLVQRFRVYYKAPATPS
jgi:hypothetical protein